jgi:AraC-like DNA-binding protein
MDRTSLPAYDMQKPQYIRKSKLENIGLWYYSYWILDEGYLSTPAYTAVHIAYILDGYGYYGNIKVKAGDVVAFGLNTSPIRCKVHNLSVYILDMDFKLFYSITGLKPSVCHGSIFLDKKNFFFQTGKILFQHPVKYWIHNIESYILHALEKNKFPVSNIMERVMTATKEIEKNRDLHSIARDMEISSRQLQRDFHSILGLSLKEYMGIRRFYGAAHKLKNQSINEVISHCGFYDQSHMTKEFKKRSGWTPKEVSAHHYY